jgi:hypothetical protein
MIIGVLTLSFRLHGNDSLKGKRRVSKSLGHKLRNTFNVAVGEVADQELHGSLVLGVVTVGNEAKHVRSRLHKCMLMTEAVCEEELVGSEIEIFAADPGGFSDYNEDSPDFYEDLFLNGDESKGSLKDDEGQ